MHTSEQEILPPVRNVQRFIHHYRQGDYLCRQGDPGHTMFVVSEGEIDVILETSHGEVHLATLGKGQSFGEISLVSGDVRTASVRVRSQTLSVVEIDKARFVYLVGQQPAFALAVMSRLCKMVQETNRKLQTL